MISVHDDQTAPVNSNPPQHANSMQLTTTQVRGLFVNMCSLMCLAVEFFENDNMKQGKTTIQKQKGPLHSKSSHNNFYAIKMLSLHGPAGSCFVLSDHRRTKALRTISNIMK